MHKRIVAVSRFTAVALLMLFSGCDKNAKSSQEEAKAARYQVRARVTGIPKGGEGKMVALAHEPIPEFMSREGKKVGMPAMTMGFALDPSLKNVDLKKGDQVEATFLVLWNERPPLKIIKIKRLPATLELNLHKE